MTRLLEVDLFDEVFDASGDRFSCALNLGPALQLVRRRIFSGAVGDDPVPLDATRKVRRHAGLLDHAICRAWSVLTRYTGGEPDPRLASVTLLATGDHGRRELQPHSVIELLLLYRDENGDDRPVGTGRALPAFFAEAGVELRVEALTLREATDRLFRDPAGEKPGCAALLEARYLTGDEELLRSFRREVAGFLGERGTEHLAHRIADERRRQQFELGYRAAREPDLVDSPGGLRDLHELLALDRVSRSVQQHPASPLSPWEEQGSLDRFADLKENHDRLIGQRTAAHLAAGSRSDRFVPDRACGTLREHHLQARLLWERLERQLFEIEWMSGEGEARDRSLEPRSVGDGLVVRADRLQPEGDELFLEDPIRLLKLFVQAGQQRLRISERLLLLARRDADRHADRLARDQRTAALLRAVLRLPGESAAFLQGMHRARVLGAALPEFEDLSCLVREDPLFEHAADQHALRAVAVIDRWERGEGDESCRQVLSTLTRPDLLKIALLIHDIERGGEAGPEVRDGSRLPRVLDRFGLGNEEREIVTFLVEQQDTMLAWSRRLPDRFEERMSTIGSAERARLLYLFTCADIKATSRSAWSRFDLDLLRSLAARLEAGLGGTKAGATNRDEDPQDQKDPPDRPADRMTARNPSPGRDSADVDPPSRRD